MKTGRTINDLAAELTRQRTLKADFLAPTTLIEPAVPHDGGLSLRLGAREYAIRPVAHRQLAEFAGVPQRYYDRMLADAPFLLKENVAHWLGAETKTRLVRTMGDDVRAFLSDRYRPLDHADLVEAAMPKLIAAGATIESCEITETRLYLKAVVPNVRAEIPPAGVKDFRWGHDHLPIDVVQPGIVISNSEVGIGALSIQPAVHTIQCSNLAVFNDNAMRKSHLGGGAGGDAEIQRYLTDETRQKMDAALWGQVADLVDAALTGRVFDDIVNRLRRARGHVVAGQIGEIVAVVREQFALTDGEATTMLGHLAAGGDPTLYGVSAALTRSAQDAEDYDRATELEQIGAQIIDLPRPHWSGTPLALAA